MRKWMLAMGVGGVLVLGMAALLVGQSTIRRDTVIPDYIYGVKLNGSTTITGASGAQNSAVVLPANSVGGGEVSGMGFDLVFCGQADENGTIYLSPAHGVNMVDWADGVDYSIAGTACDGLDGATEATQDLVLFPQSAFKVMGMYCMTNGTLGAGETLAFTFRAGAADTTPAVSCSLAAAETQCHTGTGTTTNVAANTAVAVQAVQVSNNADDDLLCTVKIMLQ